MKLGHWRIRLALGHKTILGRGLANFDGDGDEAANLGIERYAYGMRDRLSAGCEKGGGQKRELL